MEFLTLFFIIVTSLLCVALAAAFVGSRPTTFEQAAAVAESLSSSGSKARGPQDSKKKKTKKRQSEKKSGSKNSGIEGSEEDESLADEDVAVGLLHARGIGLKTEETANKPSPRAMQKGK